jgi:hypothetical protein
MAVFVYPFSSISHKEASRYMECHKCNASEDEKTLKKCPVCFKYFCQDCATNRGGRLFCSKYCADFFFFGDGD